MKKFMTVFIASIVAATAVGCNKNTEEEVVIETGEYADAESTRIEIGKDKDVDKTLDESYKDLASEAIKTALERSPETTPEKFDELFTEDMQVVLGVPSSWEFRGEVEVLSSAVNGDYVEVTANQFNKEVYKVQFTDGKVSRIEHLETNFEGDADA